MGDCLLQFAMDRSLPWKCRRMWFRTWFVFQSRRAYNRICRACFPWIYRGLRKLEISAGGGPLRAVEQLKAALARERADSERYLAEWMREEERRKMAEAKLAFAGVDPAKANVLLEKFGLTLERPQ